jgi:hypothetical protein
MAIVFHCKCGHSLRAQENAAGKRTRCPGCNQLLSIPGTAKPSSSVVGAVPGSAQAVAVSDPFAPELDWSSLESPAPAESDPQRPKSGGIKIDSVSADAPIAEAPRPEDGSRQYRILTQKDQGFAGKFNAVKLEEMLNDHARRGWSLKVAVTMNLPGHGGHHDELVVILER